MIKLIQNIDAYAPGHLGKKDVFIVHDKIVKIADAGSLSIPSYFPESEQIDGTNLILTPGFIDCHVHVSLEEAAKVDLPIVHQRPPWKGLPNLA